MSEQAVTTDGNRLHIFYSFPNRIGVPGIGTTAWQQVAGLVELGVKVTLFCGTCERPLPGLHRLVETMKVQGFKIPYRLFGNERVYRRHDRVVAKSLRNASEKVDVVHCWPLGSLNTLRDAKTAGVLSVLERPNAHTAFAYEAVALEHEKLGLDVPKGYTHAFSTSRLNREELEYSAGDMLACPSDFVASTFLDRGFDSNRLMRHQYGYDPSRFWTHPPIHGRPSEGPFVAIFAGRCEPRKGLHYALQAWHESGAAEHGRFIICGSYVPGYREILKPWLQHPSIVEMGYVENVAEEMRKADVLVLPSIEEGSALVTYEARACGCILLVSDASGAPCSNGVNGYVHPARDVATLRKHFELLASDSQLRDRLRSASLAGVADLTWQAAAGGLLQAYRNLLNKQVAGKASVGSV